MKSFAPISGFHQFFGQHKERGRADAARHQQGLSPARRVDIIGVSQRAEKINLISRSQIRQRLRAAPQNLVNEINAAAPVHGHAAVIGHRAAQQRLANPVWFEHRELARQYRDLLIEAQSQIAVTAPGSRYLDSGKIRSLRSTVVTVSIIKGDKGIAGIAGISPAKQWNLRWEYGK